MNDAIRLVHSQVDLENNKVVIIGAKGWHPGVVGIVASRIKDEFSRPAIVIAFDKEGIGKGSARSIPNLDLYEALSYAAKFLEGYGDHPMAAGLTVREDKFENFKSLFLKSIFNVSLLKKQRCSGGVIKAQRFCINFATSAPILGVEINKRPPGFNFSVSISITLLGSHICSITSHRVIISKKSSSY